MIEVLREIRNQPWKPVQTWQFVTVSTGFVWLAYLLLSDEDGFIFLDYVNLVFHEAGHPIFGIFGRTPGLYGGTIGQLVFPTVAGVAFWAQREAVSCAVVSVWFFENFLNIARYMADARARVLPLVGGGEHDWTAIFNRWGIASADTGIAHAVAIAGWVGMLGVWGWLGWRWWKLQP